MKLHKKLLFIVLAFSTVLTSCTKSADPIDPNEQFPPVIDPPVIVPPVVTPPAVNFAENSSMYLGNPSNATDNINTPNNYLFDEGYYAVSYSENRGIANWVSWHVQASDNGSAPRQDDFRANPRMPSGWYAPDAFSYTGYGFDRGHLCPSSDRTSTVAANSSTFLMTNIFPQAPNNNQQIWANLETYCRQLVDQGNELFIIAGTYGEGGTGNNGFATTLDNGRITVPATVWKVIVVLPEHDEPNNPDYKDLDRININTRVIAVSMPNENGLGGIWRNFRVTVDQIEAATGYNLLSRLSPDIQDIIESQIDTL